MKRFFNSPAENKTVNEPLKNKILATYEKAGLLPIYTEAFKQVHQEILKLKKAKLEEGMDPKEVDRIFDKKEEEAQIAIVSQGDKMGLELLEQIQSNSKTSSHGESSTSNSFT